MGVAWEQVNPSHFHMCHEVSGLDFCIFDPLHKETETVFFHVDHISLMASCPCGYLYNHPSHGTAEATIEAREIVGVDNHHACGDVDVRL